MMADENVSASISITPYYGTEKPIASAATAVAPRTINFTLEPTMPTGVTPAEEVYEPLLEQYNAPDTGVVPTPFLAPISKKPVCMNIECTGIDPLKDRIICIACKDPAETDESFELFADPDERVLLKEYLQYMAANGYDQIVGWNNTFDQTFVLYKCMKYGYAAREAIDIEVVDMMDIMRKGGQKYAGTPQKSQRLNYVAKDILGRETPIEDVEALKLEGQKMDEAFYKIDAYHVVVTALLYRRWINANENSYSASGQTYIEGVGEKDRITNYKQCTNCLAGRQLQPEETGWACDVCGALNKA